MGTEISSCAVQAGLIQGRGNKEFAPREMMTRAEGALAISNLLEYLWEILK